MRTPYDDIILGALREDMPFGDITSQAVFSPGDKSNARLTAKGQGVLCGRELFQRVFELLDENVQFSWAFKDGDRVSVGDELCRFSGATLTLLAGERTGLNLLQHLSGIATQTAQAVAAAAGTGAAISETRKTLPGLRALQKYAVRIGGGRNHRFSLSDAVMLKDNHIDAAGGIEQAVKKVRENVGHMVKIEVEARNLEEVTQALDSNADVIMLDNMLPAQIRDAVLLGKGRAIFEASGGINLGNIRQFAQTGVDVISLGALTHSVIALDVSMGVFS
ncbi:MAG: carboxylating nicotinate-nucleotide diphosphorylase [Oscillospiraceae bacterium]|nr:carboxylating nicotinate-nucleotide diphosphorylase [Oscillospiraceae bacterium]